MTYLIIKYCITGITIFAIGVGRKVNKEELKQVATSEDYVYSVNNYAALEKLEKELARKTCQGMCHISN